MTHHFHSNGKLLLTAEFLVIEGAKALALPGPLGQHLTVTSLESSEIQWSSYSVKGEQWYAQRFALDEQRQLIPQNDAADPETTQRLQQIFKVIHQLNPTALTGGLSFASHLEFPQDWGLGSSSTLLANLAQWAKVDPFELSAHTFGGSGYDIACAMHHSPITYQLFANKTQPEVHQVNFAPQFSDQLFFVHRNQKQNTRDRVGEYHQNNPAKKQAWMSKASALTEAFLNCSELADFENLIKTHERLLADVLQMLPVGEELFPDFKGAVKSLGAWGGDFMLATGGEAAKAYFKTKGYHTILDYHDLVYSSH